MSDPKQFSAEEFFAQTPPPPRLEEHLAAVQRFVESNLRQGRRVVLVTVRLLSSCIVLPELSTARRRPRGSARGAVDAGGPPRAKVEMKAWANGTSFRGREKMLRGFYRPIDRLTSTRAAGLCPR